MSFEDKCVGEYRMNVLCTLCTKDKCRNIKRMAHRTTHLRNHGGNRTPTSRFEFARQEIHKHSVYKLCTARGSGPTPTEAQDVAIDVTVNGDGARPGWARLYLLDHSDGGAKNDGSTVSSC